MHQGKVGSCALALGKSVAVHQCRVMQSVAVHHCMPCTTEWGGGGQRGNCARQRTRTKSSSTHDNTHDIASSTHNITPCDLRWPPLPAVSCYGRRRYQPRGDVTEKQLSCRAALSGTFGRAQGRGGRERERRERDRDREGEMERERGEVGCVCVGAVCVMFAWWLLVSFTAPRASICWARTRLYVDKR